MTTHRSTRNMRAATQHTAATASESSGQGVAPIVAVAAPQAVMLARIDTLPAILGGVSRSTIWRWVADGKFPPPVYTPSGRPVWKMSDVAQWVDALGQRE